MKLGTCKWAAVLVMGIFLAAGAARGAVIEVTTLDDVVDAGVCGFITLGDLPGADGVVSLREALCATLSLAEDNVIRFRDGLEGLIELTDTLPTPTNPVTIIGPGKNGTGISGMGSHRIFDFNNNTVPVTVIGLDLVEGRAVGAIGGGAIRHVGDLTLINCRVMDSRSQQDGGGILNHGFGTLRLEDCLFQDNVVTAEAKGGGGVASISGGAVVAIRTRFHRNEVTGIGEANGGGLLSMSAGTVELHECEFVYNRVTGHGGGLHFSSLEPDRTLIIRNSTIHSNTAIGDIGDIIGDGGGMVIHGPALLTNTTVFLNRCDRNGGGVYVSAGLVRLINCSIFRNVSNYDNLHGGDGGGVARLGGSVELRNTLIALNENFVGNTPDIHGTLASQGHNLIGNVGATNFSSNTAGDIYGDPLSSTTPNTGATEHAQAVDPLIAPIQDNGGPVPTAALMPNSPAVNAGNNIFVTAGLLGDPPHTDARGAGFDRIVNGTVDIGAFESDGVTIPVITVNISFDHYNYRFYEFQEATLREAIAFAPAGAIIEFGGSAISLLGITNIRIGGSSSINAPLVISRDLTIRGPGTNRMRINAENAHGAIIISGSAQVEMFDIAIHNGLTSDDGGGIRVMDSASLTLKDCEIINCRAESDGGGISNKGSGAVTVIDSLIEDCQATGSGVDGGGIANKGAGAPLTIIHSTIRNCQTTGGTGSAGAGVYHSATGGLLTILDSVIALNEAEGTGGGLFCQSGDAVISGSSFYGNSCLQTNFGGGGILIAEPCTATIINTTISGNRAKDHGGGLRVTGAGSNVTLTNVTIADNIADDDNNGTGEGGGVYHPSGVLRLRNTLIARNTDRGGQTPDISSTGALISDGHNLIGNVGTTNFADNTLGDQYGDPGGTTTPNTGALESATAIDPLLSPLQNNGGLTPTHALQLGSPAIDAGDDSFVTNPPFDGPPFYDQRGEGFVRIRDGDGSSVAQVDIGAFETSFGNSPIIVSSLGDDVDGNYLPGFLTLREALTLSPSFGTIRFDPNLRGIITVNSQLVFTKSTVLDGPGADVITIQGDGGTRCVYISEDIVVWIYKLRFENGASPTGGAIHNRGTLTVNECMFVENQTGTYGGAIYNQKNLTIDRCLLEGNFTTGDSNTGGGGSVANYDAGSGATLSILNSTLAGNKASNGVGGGVFNFGDGAGDGAEILMINCTITGSDAGVGGGVFNRGSDATITAYHTSIVKGTAISVAGLYNDAGAGLVDLKNCLFGDNTTMGGDDVTNNVTANYCLFEDATTVVTGANNIIGQDPMLQNLTANGGLAPTHALLPGSPAIDVGELHEFITTDQRGMARSVDGDGNSVAVPDMGAFEFSPFILVAGDAGDDSNSGTAWTDGPGAEGPVRTIGRGLELATYGSEVWIKRGTYQPVGMNRIGAGLSTTYGTLIMKSGVALRGGFEGTEAPGAMLPPFDPNLTVIDGSIAFDGNPAWHVILMADTEEACLHDLTVTGGEAFGHPLLGGTGGAGLLVRNSTSTCGINNCVFRDNRAEASGAGVAIGNNCVMPLTNCTIRDNDTILTGGGGLSVFNADVDVTGCTISGNTTMGDGGGLWARQARMNILNTTFSGNKAGRDGGGLIVFDESANVTLNFVTITGNMADADQDGQGDGGAVFFDHVGSFSINNSILAGNTDTGGEAPDMAAAGAMSLGYNLVGNLGLTEFANNTTGDRYGDPLGTTTPGAGALESATAIHPMLGPLGNFGGPTATHIPLAGSPVIDAADPASLVDVDQRGQPRPFDGDGAGGAQSDIGAVERQAADDYSPATFYYIY